MRKLVLALAITSIISASAARADDEPKPAELKQWGKGPLEISDPSLLGTLRLEPYARSPQTTEPGCVELEARSYFENSFSYVDESLAPLPPFHRVTLAGETRDLALVARVGVFERIELGAELSVVHWQGGGVLDSLIRGWHDFLSIGSLNRNKVTRRAWVIDGTESGGSRFDAPGRFTGLGNGAVSARVLAFEGADAWPALAVSVRTWLPTSNGHFRHARGTAETFQLDASKRILDLPLFVYASVAYTYYDVANLDGLHETRHRFFGAIGLEWEIHPVISIVVHFFEETRRERKLWKDTDLPYGNYIQYIAFGVKIEPVPGLRIEPGAIEHVLDPNVTGTFGFVLNVTWDFDARALVGASSSSSSKEKKE